VYASTATRRWPSSSRQRRPPLHHARHQLAETAPTSAKVIFRLE
jgi:hypothetical protein